MSFRRFRYYTRWHQFANRRRYAAPADPWTPIWVDPAAVEYYATVSLEWGLGRVRDGDWDRPSNCDLLRETTTAKGLRQRFEEGRAWEDTALHERAAEQFSEGTDVRGYESLDRFRDERLDSLDELFESIRRDGYRPNYETTDDDPTEVGRVQDLEPLVCIGRSGHVRWNEGYHRLVIAKILGVEAIPVYVVRRHRQWQRKRDEISETPVADLSPELDADTDHPDMRDVTS